MSYQLHKADSRGYVKLSWLDTYHSFSFGDYYNPERMGVGQLRVLNDDIISPSGGFSMHPHKNMEIVTIPLMGKLKHKDNLGNEFVIKSGEIQVMSAGTGIIHSEMNDSSSQSVNLLQIWVRPKTKDLRPSYHQKEFNFRNDLNKQILFISPDGRDNTLQINQDAYFSRCLLEDDHEILIKKFSKTNCLYIFMIDGEVKLNDILLEKRDGIAIINEDKCLFKAVGNSDILIAEVPMGEKG